MSSFLRIILLVFVIGLAFARADDDDVQIEELLRQELFYKNGKSGGMLEKTVLTRDMLEKIFSVDLRDELGFVTAIDNSIMFYQFISDNNATFRYGEEEYTSLQMISSLKLFKKIMQKQQTYDDFLLELATNFNVYTAKNNDNKAVLTGYYTPHIDASQKKSRLFDVPVIVKDGGSKKPLFYVRNKIDIYNLKLEGAGVINLPDGSKVLVEYAGKSKLSQKSQKKSTKTKLAKKKGIKVASKQKVKLPTVPYFRLTDGGPYGWADVPLTPRFTAAIDKELAPMGGLIYVKSSQLDEEYGLSVMSRKQRDFANFEGFMLAQDIGGAIKGSGRVDIYCGEGNEGRDGANSIRRVGEVFLLVAKKDAIDREFEGRMVFKE